MAGTAYEQAIETYLKRIEIMEDALSASAGAYYNINLSKNLIPGTMYQVIDGKKYSINEAIGLPSNCRYQEVIDYWGNQLTDDQKPAYFDFFSTANLAACFAQGNEHVAHTYRTKDSLGNPMIAEQHVVMYEDASTGDLMAITYVIDRTRLHELQTQTEAQGKTLQEDFKQIEGLASQYFALYYLDFATGACVQYDFDAHEGGKFKRSDSLRVESFLESFRDAVSAHTHPQYRAELLEFTYEARLRETLRGKKRHTFRFQFENDHGEYQWIELVLVKLDLADAEAKGILVAFLDIDSEEREKERQQQALVDALAAAEKANKAKTAFLSNMSHDIRTPMNAIIGYTALAKSRLSDPDTVRDYLEKISVSSNHLLNLINDVLDMSRIESGSVEIAEKPVYLPGMLNELRTIIQSDVDEKHQELFVDTRGLEHETVWVDKLRLNQVLLNIASNAIKFTPEGGAIRICAKEGPSACEGYGTYEFSVTDTGIGISKDFQAHIFESFTREQTSTVSGIQGTGLGMAITRNLVEMMGGSIEVASDEGKGSTFTVALSCRIADAQAAPASTSEEAAACSNEAPATPAPHSDFSGRRILLVEDNELNREIAATILEEMGLSVDTASDGIYAAEKVANAPAGSYDLILMDIQMPQMNGFTATREIRTLANSEKANVPIVAMTANAFDEDRKAALKAGMNGFLSKPIDIKELARTLADLL